MELDGHKLYWHPEKSRRYAKGWIDPLTIELGLTARCNQNCVFCAFEYRKDAATLSFESIERFFSTAEATLSVHIAGDGEPTLYHHLGDVVSFLANKGTKVGLTTNGTTRLPLLQSALRLTWCRFSVNAGTEEVYQRIHRAPQTNLDKVFETITNVGLVNPHLTIGVQCLILDQSEPDLLALYKRCMNSEAEYLAFKPYSPHPQAPNFIQCTAGRRVHHIKEEDEYPENTPTIIIREEPPPKDYTGCLAAGTAFWLVCANGEVYPCAQFVGKEEWCMGNINHQDHEEVRTSRKAQSIVGNLRSLDCRECRHPCRCDAANRYLHRLNSPEPHDVFL